MSRRVEVRIVGDVINLKRALGDPLSLWERIRHAARAAFRAWRRTA